MFLTRDQRKGNYWHLVHGVYDTNAVCGLALPEDWIGFMDTLSVPEHWTRWTSIPTVAVADGVHVCGHCLKHVSKNPSLLR